MCDADRCCRLNMARLPNDLIRDLFDILAVVDPPRGPAGGGSLGWVKMTHVCQRWRVIGISLPQLWARIVCTFPPDAEAVLERAGDVPLIIDLDTGGRKYWDELSLGAIITRAQAVVDSGTESPKKGKKGVDWQKILDGRHLPLLLEFNVCTTGFDRRNYDWVGHVEAPALKTCTFNLYIPLIACSLQSLTISGLDWYLPRCLSVLKHCPNLSRLYISAILENGDEDSDDDELLLSVDQALCPELPVLRTIHFKDVDNLTVSFLQHIRSLDNTGLRFDDNWRFDTWDYVFSRFSDSLLHEHLSIVCTDVSFNDVSFNDNYDVPVHRFFFARESSAYTRAINILPEDLVMSKRTDRDGDALHELLEHVPNVRAGAVRTLNFDWSPDRRSPRNDMYASELESLSPSLQRFHNVTTLRIGDAGFLIIALLGSNEYTIFPDLHTLVIHPDKNSVTRERWHEVRRMLAARPIRIPRLIIRGSMLCHTTEWQHPGHFDTEHSWKQILDECYISLEEERLLVDELLDERDGIDALPHCRCWSKICGL
ncbi:hypothetical protein PENSPDRAFT_212578 [Peniophora sp. CONT]|nr:hypothetical protein PENSPDRAFT_212578 [Peniophora sp. CONT]